ncbi:MAG: AGE family epimerase/isomerase [Alistipes shahii]
MRRTLEILVWPQRETILAGVALCLCGRRSDGKCLETHRRVNDYAYRVFPDAEYGEWYGYLAPGLGTRGAAGKGNLFSGTFPHPARA